jgi:hypothetical protein
MAWKPSVRKFELPLSKSTKNAISRYQLNQTPDIEYRENFGNEEEDELITAEDERIQQNVFEK